MSSPIISVVKKPGAVLYFHGVILSDSPVLKVLRLSSGTVHRVVELKEFKKQSSSFSSFTHSCQTQKLLAAMDLGGLSSDANSEVCVVAGVNSC